MRPLLLAYPGNERLAGPLRAALDGEPVACSMRRFPDGESYVRIDCDVEQRAVALLCSLNDPDARVLPIVFMADTLRELGAREVGLVAPYLAYMRQDRRFRPGEAVTSRSFARVLSATFDWLVTVDPHLHRLHSLGEIYPIRTEVVHAAPLLAEWIRTHVEKPLVVGPDTESAQWVHAVARDVPAPAVVLEKARLGDRRVEVSAIPDPARWRGCTPVVVDDIIASAQTMIEAVRRLTAAGFARAVCLGVHGVFAENACEALRDAGAGRIVTTNSIAHATNEVDLGAILAQAIGRLLSDPAAREAPIRPA